MKIKIIKAFNGDSILITFKDEQNNIRNILIDGGVGKTYKIDKNPKGKPSYGELKSTIDELRKNDFYIDLLIITHVDDDHIGGILKWFDDDTDAYKLVKEVWFNSGALIAEYLNQPENPDLKLYINPNKTLLTSINQGIEFTKYISDNKIWERKIIIQGSTIQKFGLEFKILSPNKNKLEKLLKEWKKKDPNLLTTGKSNDYSLSLKERVSLDHFEEDSALPNGSSIAFILKHKDRNILFFGDSHPSVVIEGLKSFGITSDNPIKAELVKLAHHGSRGNTSKELLACVDSNKYIISTNGEKDEHPHKQLLARLISIKNDCEIYFNYEERMNLIFTDKDRIDYPNFKTMAIDEEFEIQC